jgi:hypothetical protein
MSWETSHADHTHSGRGKSLVAHKSKKHRGQNGPAICLRERRAREANTRRSPMRPSGPSSAARGPKLSAGKWKSKRETEIEASARDSVSDRAETESTRPAKLGRTNRAQTTWDELAGENLGMEHSWRPHLPARGKPKREPEHCSGGRTETAGRVNPRTNMEQIWQTLTKIVRKGKLADRLGSRTEEPTHEKSTGASNKKSAGNQIQHIGETKTKTTTQIQRKHKREKHGAQDVKISLYLRSKIRLQLVYEDHRPSSLFWLLKWNLSFWHTLSKLGNTNEGMRSGHEPHPFRILFIYSSKRLKIYYVSRV